MLSPLETGTIRGQPRGRGKGRETGISRGCLALAGGARRRGGRATGRSGAAWPDKAPFISYMKGALLHSAGRLSSKPERHAGENAPCQAEHTTALASPALRARAAGSGRHDQHFPAGGERGEGSR
jgi:hypothetical protein